ncbi:MAG: sensor histidine kinase [Pseudopedobacter saltans]|uniref:histidine kinase n=1 Tax=Pseudopedobacter saltans TaxID=151895 RepID=A0A2W5HC93_9SPHI|nr:MAG: sensor histidine kinase [Pseudopedobacter saltans]
MFQEGITGRKIFILIALLVVVASGFYSRYLSNQLALVEKQKVEIWARSQSYLSQSKGNDQEGLGLAIFISSSNTDIPIIETDEHDQPTGNYKNLDSATIGKDSFFLKRELASFKRQNQPIVVPIQLKPLVENKYYYGESKLQQQLRYFPLAQLVVVLLFFAFLLMVQRARNRNTQNLLWVGMAKETAHQLGTPISSLEGWVELLKEYPENATIIPELQKDLGRLMLISDRFGKIGSSPVLERKDIVPQIDEMVHYMRRRAGEKVKIDSQYTQPIFYVKISAPLFDWVIENLLKNALDAMNGKGNITIKVKQEEQNVVMDISDTGKGIAHDQLKKVFEPGFTTKKRGWGLGLALTKRIVEEYHQGKIYVLNSEVGKGTTFRIVLKSAE